MQFLPQLIHGHRLSTIFEYDNMFAHHCHNATCSVLQMNLTALFQCSENKVVIFQLRARFPISKYEPSAGDPTTTKMSEMQCCVLTDDARQTWPKRLYRE
jgi:hypothetical protein|eukprot:scaffold693_cov200-Alexandrium_tamarense.AAC.81